VDARTVYWTGALEEQLTEICAWQQRACGSARDPDARADLHDLLAGVVRRATLGTGAVNAVLRVAMRDGGEPLELTFGGRPENGSAISTTVVAVREYGEFEARFATAAQPSDGDRQSGR